MAFEALHGGRKPLSAAMPMTARIALSFKRFGVLASAIVLGASLLLGASPAAAKEDLLKPQIDKNGTAPASAGR